MQLRAKKVSSETLCKSLTANNKKGGAAYFISTLCLVALQTTTLADTVGWHDQFGGGIGLGLDLKDERIPKPPVAVFDTMHIPPYNGTGQQSINVVFSQSTLDMASSFSLNADI